MATETTLTPEEAWVETGLTQREAWLAARRKGIGGSDAAAAVGLSIWTSQLALYLDKIGEVPLVVDNADTRRGELLEPVVRQMYSDATGDEVIQLTAALRHPTIPFALANLDGVVRGRDKLLECKTQRHRTGWGDPGTAEIPRDYLYQVQHCMAVAELPRADVAVLFGDFEFAIYPIDADAELQSLLFEAEAEFWKCVEARMPPAPRDPADIALRWPKSRLASAAVGGPDELRAAAVLACVKERIKQLESIETRAEAILKLAIKDNEGLQIDGKIIATWKSAKDSERFDEKAFNGEYPELYEQFLRPTDGSRRFLLKPKAIPCDTTEILPPVPSDLLPIESLSGDGTCLKAGQPSDAERVEGPHRTNGLLPEPIVIQSTSGGGRPGPFKRKPRPKKKLTKE